ncbi:MAG: hypothetical protein WHS44_12235 [Fimbriimonadales bacterium]|nr:MAG: hypothetical protein KatS3mg018_2138 [Fimbriimonadales bacterium]
MSVMDDPARLARQVARWTAILGGLAIVASVAGGVWQVGVGMALGLLALGWAVGHFVLIVRFFKPHQNALFPRLFMLSNPLKYPLLLILAYLAVQGGATMALGFVLGVALPLAVLTGLAVREAILQAKSAR